MFILFIEAPKGAALVEAREWGKGEALRGALFYSSDTRAFPGARGVRASMCVAPASLPTISEEVLGPHAIAHAVYLGQNLLTISLSKV